MANTYGLDPNYLKTVTTPPVMAYSGGGYNPFPNYVQRAGYDTTSYNGPGGSFTQGNNGSWVGAGGQNVNDLAGYLKMKEQQKSGADFGTYQNRLSDLLNGQNSLQQMYTGLLTDPSKIQQTPGYQFALDQGNQAINRSAAAKGMLNSGNVLADLAKYGQGMASQQYDKQLQNIAGGATLNNQQVNTLTDLMHGSQNFGIQSGYFQNPQTQTVPTQIAGGPLTYYKPSTW